MKKILSIFIIVFILMSGAAFANDDRWVYIETHKHGTPEAYSIYIDYETITDNGATVNYWQRTLYKGMKKAPNGKVYDKSLVNYDYYKSLRIIKINEASFYNQLDGGDVVSSHNFKNSDPQRIIPGTAGERIIEEVLILAERKKKNLPAVNL